MFIESGHTLKKESLAKMKNKWLGELWDPKRDSYLIGGTRHPYPNWLILGVFWPPK